MTGQLQDGSNRFESGAVAVWLWAGHDGKPELASWFRCHDQSLLRNFQDFCFLYILFLIVIYVNFYENQKKLTFIFFRCRYRHLTHPLGVKQLLPFASQWFQRFGLGLHRRLRQSLMRKQTPIPPPWVLFPSFSSQLRWHPNCEFTSPRQFNSLDCRGYFHFRGKLRPA